MLLQGIYADTFAFNTSVSGNLFAQQFDLARQLIELGIDLFGYVTLTSPDIAHVEAEMAVFVDRLQQIDPNFPLRIIPLQIVPFTPVQSRLNDVRVQSMINQHVAVERWKIELKNRFTAQALSTPICDVRWAKRQASWGSRPI